MRRPLARWFLPAEPDVVTALSAQAAVTVRGLEAFAAWSHGERGKAAEVRSLEHEADAARRAVQTELSKAFVTPVNPEDLFELSERLDAVLNGAKNAVREAEVLDTDPDDSMAEMADALAAGTAALAAALPLVASDPPAAAERAAAAISCQREVERIYRRAMSALLRVEDFKELTLRRELYRRYARVGDAIEHVANRVEYTVIKQS